MPAEWRIAVELAAWCHLRVGEVLGLEPRHRSTPRVGPGRAHGLRRQWPSVYRPPEDRGWQEGGVRASAYLGRPGEASRGLCRRHSGRTAPDGSEGADVSGGTHSTPPGAPPERRSRARRSISTTSVAPASHGRTRRARPLVS
jgi:hypothetical protein